MGFEDRDYTQAESWRDPAPSQNPVTKWFVILAVVVYVMQAFTISPQSQSSAIFDLLSLKAPAVLQGQVWRLVTFAVSIHPANIIGLVFSLLIIWRFGTDLERMYGSTELGMYLLGTTLFVGVCFTAWQFAIFLPLPLEGLYGMALGLMALFATHFPRMEVYILPMIVVQLRWLVAIYALFGLFPALQAVQAGGGAVGLAYASPVLSIAFALAYRRFGWHLSAMTGNFNPAEWRRAWRSRTARHRLRVYQPSVDTTKLDASVDAILAKIHEHGSESLTEAERAVLARASERYKNRL